jgi:endoglucanase
MKALITAVVVSAALLCCGGTATAQGTATKQEKKVHEWWNERFPGEPLSSPNGKKLPLISVRGNRFVDPAGNPVLFRGVSISDPDKIEAQGHWNRELFIKVRQMGARLVRIPVHPIAWRERTPQGYLALLDQAVEWCTEQGLYVDLDWHSIGNLKTGLFESPMYVTSLEETSQFWRIVAGHFAGNNTVAFLELYNEPSLGGGRFGRVSWDEWKKINEDLIALVRSYDPQAIPLVAGFDWAYDLSPLRINPIAAEGIGYVTHPYPTKRPRPWEPKWEVDFGFAAGRYPIIATEIGYFIRKGSPASDAEYGPAIVKYLEGRGISWLAWVYDTEWGPPLIKSWDTNEFTESGEFFSQAMQGNVH